MRKLRPSTAPPVAHRRSYSERSDQLFSDLDASTETAAESAKRIVLGVQNGDMKQSGRLKRPSTAKKYGKTLPIDDVWHNFMPIRMCEDG